MEAAHLSQWISENLLIARLPRRQLVYLHPTAGLTLAQVMELPVDRQQLGLTPPHLPMRALQSLTMF